MGEIIRLKGAIIGGIIDGKTARINSAIHRCSAVLGRMTDRMLQENFGFGMTQFKILWVLIHHEGIVRQSDIATWLNQTEAAISRQIKPMSASGLLESRVDPQNRRSHMVHLTSAGKQLAQDGIKLITKLHAPVIDSLSEGEQDNLLASLEKLFEAACLAEQKSLK